MCVWGWRWGQLKKNNNTNKKRNTTTTNNNFAYEAEAAKKAVNQKETLKSYNKLPVWKPLWGDKVSMLTHIYPHKPRRKIEMTICKITRLTAHFMCGLMSDLLICKFIKCMVIHDTECPYWDQVSLNNTNQPTNLCERCIAPCQKLLFNSYNIFE